MISFAKRNLKIFFRDRSAVFFSLLASFIIIGLYVLFLGDVWTSNFNDFDNAREIMDNWVMAGLLAATSFTTTMGAFGVMVNDRTKKINKDFYSSPISRRSIAGGYVISTFLIGLILSLITLVLVQVYIIAEGGALISLSALVKMILLILLADLTNTSIMFFITSFFASESAFATASTVIGTLIGFITGIYLPIGMLPNAVQWIVKVFPPSHAAVLMRQVMMADVMNASFANVPAEYVSQFKETLGVVFKFGDTQLSVPVHILILFAAAALFFGLAVINISRKKK
jgi:multidrug/hemolysin transport system permease protein